MSGLDLTLDPERRPRRFEVINGAGGRRHWSVDDKSRIIAETLEPDAVISEVARRYGLRPQQLLAWRRAARLSFAEAPGPEALFVPAVIAAPMPEPAARRPPRPRKQKAARDAVDLKFDHAGVSRDLLESPRGLRIAGIKRKL